MKKVFKFIGIISAIILITITIGEAMEVIRKEKGVFRFEDYKTADEAKEALLKLHPVGSSVDDLVKTLEGAGANVRALKDKEIYPEWIVEDFGGGFGYKYNQGKTFVSSYEWGGVINYNKNHKIIDFGISKHYMGL